MSKQLVLGRAEHVKARAMQVTEGEIEAAMGIEVSKR